MIQLSRSKEFAATFNLPHHDVNKWSPKLALTFQKTHMAIPRTGKECQHFNAYLFSLKNELIKLYDYLISRLALQSSLLHMSQVTAQTALRVEQDSPKIEADSEGILICLLDFRASLCITVHMCLVKQTNVFCYCYRLNVCVPQIHMLKS